MPGFRVQHLGLDFLGHGSEAVFSLLLSTPGDGVVFKRRGGGDKSDDAFGGDSITADYYEEMTPGYFHKTFAGQPRLFWHFGYGTQRRALHKSRFDGTLFQVHIWYHGGKSNISDDAVSASSNTKEVIRLDETLHTRWGIHFFYLLS